MFACTALIIIFSIFIYGHYFVLGAAVVSTVIIWSFAGLRLLAIASPKPADDERLEIDDWPIYTVLVPLYKEANVVQALITHLAQLDYPQDKLEIFIICEEDDHPTIAAISQPLAKPFKLIIVPPSQPRTKPKALNVALTQARGNITPLPVIWTYFRQFFRPRVSIQYVHMY